MTRPLRGRIRVPGDKSISHRALLLGALARGTTRIRGLLDAEDVGRTLEAIRRLGCEASRERVNGAPWRTTGEIDCGNSGTTARLLLGALAPRAGAKLDGDASLRRRPMGRVTGPLSAMGARFEGGPDLPLSVIPSALHGTRIALPVASAQVKSALLLAALAAEGETQVAEPTPLRDHTERMLRAMGADLRTDGGTVVLRPGPLDAAGIDVPGDLSSAAFWIVGAAIVPGSDLVIEGVGLNPTRTGLLDVLARMGADCTIESLRDAGPEPSGDVRIRHASLRATTVEAPEVPRLLDEIPILAVAAAFAEGTTEIRGAAELRVKESDRIAAITAGLHAIGVACEALPDGLRIEGTGPAGPESRGAVVDSQGDHRIAMAFLVAGLRVPVQVPDTACIATSYPAFPAELARRSG